MTSESKGFGFVCFEDRVSVAKAVLISNGVATIQVRRENSTVVLRGAGSNSTRTQLESRGYGSKYTIAPGVALKDVLLQRGHITTPRATRPVRSSQLAVAEPPSSSGSRSHRG